MQTIPIRVVLDLDGVILRTNGIKHQAMLGLFSSYPDRRDQIDAYIFAHGGVDRRTKLAAIFARILEVEPTPELLRNYLSRYAAALERALAQAPMVDGVASFLQSGLFPFYVSSSAPEAEVRTQLERRSLDGLFRCTFGLETPKVEALRRVGSEPPEGRVVFMGDALSDLQAAQQAGVGFIAVVNEWDNFGNAAVTKLASFNSQAKVSRLIREAAYAT